MHENMGIKGQRQYRQFYSQKQKKGICFNFWRQYVCPKQLFSTARSKSCKSFSFQMFDMRNRNQTRQSASSKKFIRVSDGNNQQSFLNSPHASMHAKSAFLTYLGVCNRSLKKNNQGRRPLVIYTFLITFLSSKNGPANTPRNLPRIPTVRCSVTMPTHY